LRHGWRRGIERVNTGLLEAEKNERKQVPIGSELAGTRRLLVKGIDKPSGENYPGDPPSSATRLNDPSKSYLHPIYV
jgi:hypothetical protein